MNCADSVLNSDELPVRGIDQCPSTLSTQWSLGLVLVKWNRLLALFKRGLIKFMFCWSRSLFKMCKSSAIQKSPIFFFASFHSVNLVLLILGVFAICSLRSPGALTLGLKRCPFSLQTDFYRFKNEHMWNGTVVGYQLMCLRQMDGLSQSIH